MSKKILITLALLVVLGGGTRPAFARFKKEYKMQVNVGPTTAWGRGAAKFAELAEKKTGGKIKVKPYYGSSLLKGAQLNSTQMVALGAIDLAFESTINTAPVIPEMNIFSLPFFVSTFQRVDRLEKGGTGKLLFQAMKSKGVVPLAWGENGFRQLTNSRRSIRTPEDLRHLKIRVVGSPLFIDIFRELQADPIDMNWGDAISAFQQGTVDGQENPVAILLVVGIYQCQKYLTAWNYLIDPLILYWNKKEWESFPPSIRKALRSAAAEAGRYEKALVRAGLDGEKSLRILKDEFNCIPEVPYPLEYLKKKGMKITTLTEKEREAFRQKLLPVKKKWIKKLGEKIYQAALLDLKQ